MHYYYTHINPSATFPVQELTRIKTRQKKSKISSLVGGNSFWLCVRLWFAISIELDRRGTPLGILQGPSLNFLQVPLAVWGNL